MSLFVERLPTVPNNNRVVIALVGTPSGFQFAPVFQLLSAPEPSSQLKFAAESSDTMPAQSTIIINALAKLLWAFFI